MSDLQTIEKRIKKTIHYMKQYGGILGFSVKYKKIERFTLGIDINFNFWNTGKDVYSPFYVDKSQESKRQIHCSKESLREAFGICFDLEVEILKRLKKESEDTNE